MKILKNGQPEKIYLRLIGETDPYEFMEYNWGTESEMKEYKRSVLPESIRCELTA